MTHPSQDELILFHYGEAGNPARMEAHLIECAECRKVRLELERVLAAAVLPVPERGDDYGDQVWRRLAPRLRLQPVPSRRLWVLRRWAAVATLAASLVMAFLLGRHWPSAPSAAPISAPVRERILLVAVGDHLERSQMALVELANADAAAPAELAPVRRLARDLVGANRLYRQAAAQAGESGMADVLDDLERMLVEIARSPDDLSAADVKMLQRRLEAKGLLFKVRVIGSRVREREKEAVGPSPAVVS